jgi:hypothetical protein
MVISSSTRKKLGKPGSRFWGLNKSGEESWDAMMLAAYLVGALFFSIISVMMLFVLPRG